MKSYVSSGSSNADFCGQILHLYNSSAVVEGAVVEGAVVEGAVVEDAVVEGKWWKMSGGR